MWTVVLTERFTAWLEEQEGSLQEKMAADLMRLEFYGSQLPRPYADGVKGSRYRNMKELRV